MIYNSSQGGFSSGFSGSITNVINLQNGKSPVVLMTIMPSKNIFNSVIEPYNSILYLNDLFE